MRTLVIGLGNPILTDDGAGIYAARVVERVLPPDAKIDVTELAVGGLGLMEAMIGYERVVLIDAFWQPGGEPGQIVEFDAGHLPDTLNTASAHDVNLPTALRIGRRLGASLPSNEHIQIIGIQAREVLTFGDVPTPKVEAAIPEAAARVLQLLDTEPVIDPYTISAESCWRL